MWVLATLLYGREENIDIIQTTKEATQNWRRQTLEVMIQVIMTAPERLPEKIFCVETILILVHMEGRKPKSFKSGKKEHLR